MLHGEKCVSVFWGGGSRNWVIVLADKSGTILKVRKLLDSKFEIGEVYGVYGS
jgi:hypothetical protein